METNFERTSEVTELRLRVRDEARQQAWRRVGNQIRTEIRDHIASRLWIQDANLIREQIREAGWMG